MNSQAHLSFAFIYVFYKVSMLWDKAKFLCSTLNPSKKIHPPKTRKTRSSVFSYGYTPNTGCPVLGGISYQLRLFHIRVFCFQEISRRRFYLYWRIKQKIPNLSFLRSLGSQCGAGGGGRTRTMLPSTDFESVSSANSNTPA